MKLVLPCASHRGAAGVEIAHVYSEMRKVILKGKSNSRLPRHRRMFSSEMNCSRSFRHPAPFLHCCLQYAAMCRPRKQIHEDAKVHKYLSHLCSFTGDCARRVLRRMPCVERRSSLSRRSCWFFFRLFETFRRSSTDTAWATTCDYTRTGAGGNIYCLKSLI